MSFYKGPELRAWQLEAITAWEAHHSGIIQAVPGAGKTLLAIKLLTSKLDENPNLKVLIVCPRLTLIQQWVDAITSFSKIKKSEIYEISSNNETQAYSSVQNKLAHNKIFVSTFHQIKQFFDEVEWKKHEWFLIVDEVHNTQENYKFPDLQIKYKLGLSATPKKRGKNTDFNLGGIIYSYDFYRALQDKIILDPVIKIVLYSVNDKLFKQLENKKGNTLDLAESAFDDFPIEAPVRDNNADSFTSKSTDFVGIQNILQNKFNIGKENSVQTLVFVNRIKKADLLNRALSESFSKKVSRSYHSKSEEYHIKNNFSEIKKQFAQGQFNVLISVGTLGEGIDFPHASHGIIASPVYNSGAFVQKVGRLLRAYGDHKKAVIYYYIPSELVTRLLTDEKIEPNYFKSIIKIADKNSDLYFVDRESLNEEKGSMEDLLLQGSAYARNDYVKKAKIPHDLDQIMRFFKRTHPERLKAWKQFYEVDPENPEKVDFAPLRQELSKAFRPAHFFSKNLVNNLKNIENLQKKFSEKKFNNLNEIKHFVRTALNQQVVTKIKYGLVLIGENKSNVSVHSSEQETLFRLVSAELSDFCSRTKETKSALTSLNSAIQLLEKNAKDKKLKPSTIDSRIKALTNIAKTFFSLQSAFLDELDLVELARSAPSSENTIFLTIGKDVFLSKRPVQLFSYPRDFGVFAGEEEKEVTPKAVLLTPVERFVKELMLSLNKDSDYTNLASAWLSTKQAICTKLELPLQPDKEIIKELEKQKFRREFSLIKILFVLEAIRKNMLN